MKLSTSHGHVIVFNTLTTLVLLVLSEAVVRLFLSYNASFQERAGFNLQYYSSGYVRYFSQPNQVLYNIRGGNIISGQIRYRINQYGYRGEDFPIQKDEREIRIAILGGSHVFDLHSYDYEQNPGFPHQIQNALRKDGHIVRVINAGLPGHDTRDFPAKVLLDLHRYAPDIIVVSSLWNDLKWISHTSDSTLLLTEAPKAVRKNPMIEEVNTFDRVLGFSAFYRKARDFYWQHTLDLDQHHRVNEGIRQQTATHHGDFTRGLQQYRTNLVGVIQLIRSVNALPVLAVEERLVSAKNTPAAKKTIQYYVINIESHDELVQLFDDCDDILASVARELRVPFIDIHQELAGDLRFFRDHVHTTPAGSELIAQRYTDFLKPLVEQISQQRDPTGVELNKRQR